MRSFLTIFALLVWWMPALSSASALKGVRGRKSSLQTRFLKDEDKEMEKKCKKYAEPKAVAEAHELKATKADKKDKADPKGAEEKAADDKAKGDGVRYRHRRRLQDDSSSDETPAPPAPKEDKAAKEAAQEAECLEWFETTDREDGGSDVVLDPSMGSTGTSSSEFDSINVDCEAIANDKGPKDTHSVSFNVNIDVLKDADATLNDIYTAMEEELQTKVAPRIAGCTSGRLLAEETSKIVHVDFGELEFDHQGCDSSLAKEAAQVDGVCMASDVPVDVYFVGDFPENAIAKVEVAIEEHEWDVDGLLKTSEVAIVQTASTLGSSGGPSAGMIGGIVAAVVVCLCGVCGYCYYKRGQDDEVVAKAELETDEESDDEKQKVAFPEVQARRVG